MARTTVVFSLNNEILEQQIAYYRARANEYDEWFLREGRYDRGPDFRREWFREIGEIETVLRSLVHEADVLELACGTGLWTQHLVRNNPRVVAVDSSPEVIALNRQRLGLANVEFHVANIFDWTAPCLFDAVFFSFWLSHVPPARFDEFWNRVARALKPGGRVFFLDSLPEQSATARDQGPLDHSGIVRRKLNDGREFDIVKIYYEPRDLNRRLAEKGWQGWVRTTGTFFLYGSMVRGSQ